MSRKPTNMSLIEQYITHSFQRTAIEFGNWLTNESFIRASARGHANLRPAHGHVLHHLRLKGSRVVDIARLEGLTKNAIGQLATELEEMGYVERSPDPTDGRAKILRYTAKGLQLLEAALAISEEIRRELIAHIGEDAFNAFVRTLDDIHQLITTVDPKADGQAPS